MRILKHIYTWVNLILILISLILSTTGQVITQAPTAIQIPASSQAVNQAQHQAQPLPSPNLNLPAIVPNSDNISPLIQALANPTLSVVAKSPVTSPKTIIKEQTVQVSAEANEDPIIHLDYSSIQDQVLGKRTANFVYFNANFNNCRNCDRFLNIWKELAYDIQWWRQVIKLFTINCSDEDNIEVCRRAGVNQFPQVKFYWVMSSSLDHDGQRLRILGKSIHAMRHMITDKVIESYVEHNKILADKKKQQHQNALVGFSMTGLPQSTSNSNPLSALMGPLLGQIGTTDSRGSGESGSESIGSIMSLLSSSTSGKAGSSPLSGLLANLGGQSSLTQLLGSFVGSSGSFQQKLNIQPLPSNWPEFEPIITSNTHQLLDMLPLDLNRNVGAFLIMETPEFLYTGIEVMLDLNPYSNQTYIARVSDERSQLSKNLTLRPDIMAPALVYVSPSREFNLVMTAPKYTNDEDLRRMFVKAALEKRQIKRRSKILTKAADIAQPLASHNQEDDEILSKSNQVYRNDLINTLRASLMDQVFRHPDLTDDQYNALVKYVYVIINYYPFRNGDDDDSLKFFKRLHTWLQNQVSPVDVMEYKKQFHDIDEVFPQYEWVACKSLSGIKAVPNKGRKSNSLFENPAQLGKMVSNITRLFRNHQHQSGNLKNLFNLFNLNKSPVMLNQNQNKYQKNSNSSTTFRPTTSAFETTRKASSSDIEDNKRSDSPLERLFKSLTSGSLGSDSSILKLISSALGGSSGGDLAVGKSKFAREYPCGAWKLAHVLVVNEYKKDSPRKEVKHIVLQTLYQYLLHFYACAACGNRVAEVSSEFRLILDDHLQHQGDSVMFLWKVHNRVNQRLLGESRPGSPNKVQFPSESLCPKCRYSRAQNDLASTPNWNEKQLFQFLYHHYKQENLMFISNSSESSSATHPHIVPHIHSYLTTFIMLVVIGVWNKMI